jgi:hypothetical protein
MKQIQGKRPCIQKIEYLQHRNDKKIIKFLRIKNLIYSRDYSPCTILKGIKP